MAQSVSSPGTRGPHTPSQLDLFAATAQAYMDQSGASNTEIYEAVADRLGIDPGAHVAPVGADGVRYNLFHRNVRWVQQSLKKDGLLERVPDERGIWRLTGKGRFRLQEWQAPGTGLVAFSTRLGVAILGDCRAVFRQVDAPIALCITSPPYPLASPRAYGNKSGDEYIDFICEALEPIVASLKTGGSLVLNISNDIFERGSPARSLYREKLVLALAERLGLFKMDEIIWHNRQKAPGPTQWACKTRQQLTVAWEPLYWFTNDPQRCESDNRRVLQPHTERHAQMLAEGGERRARASSDGAHAVRPGSSYVNATPGRIPGNVFEAGHTCAGRNQVQRYAKAHGLPPHGAMFPERLVEFFVEFLTQADELVVDPFSGGGTVAAVAERLGREWIATDLMLEYMQAAGAARFCPDDAWFNPALWHRESDALRPRQLAAA
ncbi:site-specific DNA-methyltransferase [Thioalkalivibrio sp. ALE16]|uniref:site-specific DNA-methyltransferase n=1 Tax=Thioalkalivibrio sp. ALE16 TaxID=1158172 RepID=UPI00036036BC|nr:site-specific DNA-methyltransferase [Thioalkalivibrio sp. ALE16]